MSREHTDRECPRCGADSVVSAREAKRVYGKHSDTRTQLRTRADATHVCSSCGALKV